MVAYTHSSHHCSNILCGVFAGDIFLPSVYIDGQETPPSVGYETVEAGTRAGFTPKNLRIVIDWESVQNCFLIGKNLFFFTIPWSNVAKKKLFSIPSSWYRPSARQTGILVYSLGTFSSLPPPRLHLPWFRAFAFLSSPLIPLLSRLTTNRPSVHRIIAVSPSFDWRSVLLELGRNTLDCLVILQANMKDQEFGTVARKLISARTCFQTFGDMLCGGVWEFFVRDSELWQPPGRWKKSFHMRGIKR